MPGGGPTRLLRRRGTGVFHLCLTSVSDGKGLGAMPLQRQRLLQRRLLAPALLAGFGLAALAPSAAAQPQPYSEEPPRYRSNRPYETQKEAEAERAPARAEEGVPPGPKAQAAGESEEKTAPARGSPWALTGGADFRDQYFFRGYRYTNSGINFQPYATLNYTAYQEGDFAITPHVGTWLNFTEDQGPESPKHWQEVDLITGIAVDVGDFNLDFQYTYYISPNGFFEDTHEIGVDVRYDDSRFFPRNCPISGLNPSVAFFYEIKDQTDHDYNTYVGVGLEPTLRDFNVGPVPLSVSFPMALGGSYDGYYQDDDGHNANAGYWQVGVKCGLPLPRTGYGVRWGLEAELDYLRLLADSTENANGGDNDDFTFRIGLKFE